MTMAWAILSCYKGGEGEAALSRRLLDDSGGSAPTDASAAVVDFAAERRAAAGGASRTVGRMGGDGIRATKIHADEIQSNILDLN